MPFICISESNDRMTENPDDTAEHKDKDSIKEEE
jgi:hypothetical protein